MSLTIRKASAKEDTVIAAFGKKTFESAFGSDNDPEDMQAYLENAFSAEQIGRELKTPGTIFLLAYDNETLVGYAKLQGGLPPACIRDSNAIELGRLYVTTHHMGKGFGSQLIQACVDEASRQGYKTVWLGVWKRNFRAQLLYERFGFVRVGAKTFVLGTDVQQDAVYARSL